MPSRLKPTNPVADTAILVGDPGRALMLAQELLVNPLMSNHARGLWGYSAKTEQGMGLTIQATGMGGPSAAIVLSDLARLGVRRAIRLGTCEALAGALEPGTIVSAQRVEANDGVSLGLADDETGPRALSPDPDLGRELASAFAGVAVESSDLSYLGRHRLGLDSRDPGQSSCQVADLQTGALFSVAARLGIRIAALLVVERAHQGPDAGDESPSWQALDTETLEARFKQAGALALQALTKAQAQP